MSSERIAVLLVADGARPDILRDLVDRGDMPNISRYLIEPGSFVTGTTVFPSTTGPAYIPFIFGRFPGHANIPGIRWFDREKYSRSRFGTDGYRSYVGLGYRHMDSDIDPQGYSLYELAKDHAAVFPIFSRGLSKNGDNTGPFKFLYYLRAYLVELFGGTKGEVWHSLDKHAARCLLKAIRNMPRLLFGVFSAIDEVAHLKSATHPSVQAAYRRVDDAVGSLAGIMKEKGVLEQALFCIVSDHGMSDTHTHFDLDRFLDRRFSRVLYYPKVWRGFGRLSAVNMVSGNSMSNVYVRNPLGWQHRTSIEQVRSLVDELLAQNAVDLIAGCDESGSVHVASERGDAVVTEDNGIVHVVPLNGGDPFGFGGGERIWPLGSVPKDSAKSDYPDGPVQLLQHFASPRSGDLVVSAKPGYDLRAHYEHREHRASHGSLHRLHMEVPVVMNRRIMAERPRTVDIYATIVDWLGLGAPGTGEWPADGTSLLRRREYP
jgi:hypothetical protein